MTDVATSMPGPYGEITFPDQPNRWISMAMYEVSCATREQCSGGSHIVSIGIDGADGHHDVPVKVARLMLSAEDNLYTIAAGSGEKVDVRKGRCDCGVKTLKSSGGKDGADPLPDLTPCSEPVRPGTST